MLSKVARVCKEMPATERGKTVNARTHKPEKTRSPTKKFLDLLKDLPVGVSYANNYLGRRRNTQRREEDKKRKKGTPRPKG